MKAAKQIQLMIEVKKSISDKVIIKLKALLNRKMTKQEASVAVQAFKEELPKALDFLETIIKNNPKLLNVQFERVTANIAQAVFDEICWG